MMINIDIICDNLEELSSIELQERLWLGKNDNLMSSYTEAVCGLFDDGRISLAIEKGYLQKKFSANLCCKVNKLQCLVDKIDDGMEVNAIIDHPRMIEIRKLSKELLALFKDEV
ncbi:hypothetical protein F9L33_14910 [Amylibacter sp. SFDW26]|uniref:hypothetical protein n=1 Tax=Amylibacter sp. SFDW26 TaxID=2652722 RepID=UPI00126162D5|nr:hypothetical protein [Amylibacter sp. SFDW26]KAB7610181.1 hypothetical protein F9L33_14910 [Amylibacter sp. SFDW26]